MHWPKQQNTHYPLVHYKVNSSFRFTRNGCSPIETGDPGDSATSALGNWGWKWRKAELTQSGKEKAAAEACSTVHFSVLEGRQPLSSWHFSHTIDRPCWTVYLHCASSAEWHCHIPQSLTHSVLVLHCCIPESLTHSLSLHCYIPESLTHSLIVLHCILESLTHSLSLHCYIPESLRHSLLVLHCIPESLTHSLLVLHCYISESLAHSLLWLQHYVPQPLHTVIGRRMALPTCPSPRFQQLWISDLMWQRVFAVVIILRILRWYIPDSSFL